MFAYFYQDSIAPNFCLYVRFIWRLIDFLFQGDCFCESVTNCKVIKLVTENMKVSFKLLLY